MAVAKTPGKHEFPNPDRHHIQDVRAEDIRLTRRFKGRDPSSSKRREGSR